MADASPTKWHRAHVTWFFEQFLLVPHARGYEIFDERFPFLFNSYYVAAGPRHARPQRGLITRPNGAEVSAYRAHVDAAVERLIDDRAGGCAARARDSRNRAASRAAASGIAAHRHPPRLRAESDRSGLRSRLASAGRGGEARTALSICRPAFMASGMRAMASASTTRRRATIELIGRLRIARRLVTNARMARIHRRRRLPTPSLWLSDGWATVQAEGWHAPGYWRARWTALARHDACAACSRSIPPRRSCHVSYYEADAFARWAGKRFADRSRNGKSPPAPALLNDAFGIGLAMDAQRLSAPYPGYRADRRRARRVQRQVHGQPDGVARLARWRRRMAMRASATAISSTPRHAGNSAACGWSTLR